jgi:curli production assembly/transport component CsgG
MTRTITRALITLLAMFMLASCAGNLKNKKWSDPEVARSPIQSILDSTPPLDGPPITIAVYAFQDKTGQRKPNSNFSVLSSAVTQGSEVWVINALKKIGKGTWFQPVERIGLDNLVKERQLIRSTREVYEKGKAPKLKPMLFAGLIIEGGVVGYDSNVESGGAGARYFGIGMNTQYRMDQITVSMRVVSVQTGEILLSVAVEKIIASHKIGADVFRFLDMSTKALEIETGSAINEPVNYAVRAAIEASIVEIVQQGEQQGLWKYKKLGVPKTVNKNEEMRKHEHKDD